MKRRVLSFIIALALCLNLCPMRVFAADEGTGGGLCPHHPAHTDECGYVPEDPDAPCTFVCPICPIEDLIGKLPDSVSAYGSEQVQAQLNEIYALYDGLAADERQQVDLSPCLFLQGQLDEMGVMALSDAPSDGIPQDRSHILDTDRSYPSPYQVSIYLKIDTNGFTFTAPNSTAIRVLAAGELHLTGTVAAKNGAGVEVLSGGILSIAGPDTNITGTTYGLDIASGAEVQLSTGTYIGRTAAIRTENGNFAALLKPGYAYFDGSGKPLLPAEVAGIKTVTVGLCTDHLDKAYTHIPGSTEHTWTCQYCGTTVTEPCTFTFDDNIGTDACGNLLTIAVDEDDLTDLVYDSTSKEADVTITVTLTDPDGVDTVLEKDTDYEVEYESRIDAGEITVTVTGITFIGTFTKTYYVEQDEPGISWDNTTWSVDYDSRGLPVNSASLPDIIIAIRDPNEEDLHPCLQYAYREVGDEEFIDGLPTNAGKYEVKAYIPESQNYKAAETDQLLTLTINKISALIRAPQPTTPTYDGNPHELVTAGEVQNGAVIEYAQSKLGPYSPDIPIDVNAGDYTVWYRVADTDNYIGTDAAEVENVLIQRKTITPKVTLSAYTYLYDGGYKEPTVTVKDDITELRDTEYKVEYGNHQNVSTDGNPATVTVSDKPGGNYAINTVTVDFKITSRTQEALSITNKPNTVTYGLEFTLSTLGGSGNGNVTWEIVDDDTNDGSATVNPTSGLVKVTGAGTITVKATKSGVDPETGIQNYDDATATWTFVADKKPVVAIVTADDKAYNGSIIADVHAVVEQGVLPGDEITITGLTGTFSDENAGANKTVTVKTDDAKIEGVNFQHYNVSYSSLTVKATINKAVAKITTPPDGAALIYNGTAQALINDANLKVDPSSGVSVEYALSKDGPYSPNSPKVASAGAYTVWYRVQETSNYTGLEPASVDVTIAKKTVTPTIELSGEGLTKASNGTYSYIYDGNAKMPTVTLTDEDGNEILFTEYTVAYNNNTDAGNATVTVTAKDDGNYAFTANPVTENFTIKQEQAKVVTDPEAAGNPLVFNTREQRLVTEGAGYGGRMVYSTDGGTTFTDQIPAKTNADDYTVYYKVAGDDNHSDSDVGSVTVTIAPKTVTTPTIELLDENGALLVSCAYDGTAKEPAVKVIDGSTEIDADEYNIAYINNVDAGTATVRITDKRGGNYAVSGSAEFTITKAVPVVTDPIGNTLQYNGAPQELVKAGGSNDGTVVYSVNGGNYSAAIPTATAVAQYTVNWKVLGNANHSDTAPKTLTVGISKNTVKLPAISLSSDTFKYNGNQQKPTVIVYDDNGLVIPENEYTVTITGDKSNNMVDVDTYTVKITTPPASNYVIADDSTGKNTRTFEIVPADQETISITGTQAQVRYGDVIQLGTTGGTGAGTITWTVTDTYGNSVNSTITRTGGLLTVKDVGTPIVVTATRSATGGNYSDVSATWEFSAGKKQVTAVVTVADKDYDGTTAIDDDDITVTVKDSDLAGPDDSITISGLTAAFESATVGVSKTVTLNRSQIEVSGTNSENYDIIYPTAVTASINRVDARIQVKPAANNRTYNGNADDLVTGGSTENGIGTIEYSRSQYGEYLSTIPQATDAGTYTVWYRIADSVNYMGTIAASIEVEIKKATPSIGTYPTASGAEGELLRDITLNGGEATGVSGGAIGGTFAWENDSIEVEDGKTYNVIFTPNDTVNYEKVTFPITVTDTNSSDTSGTNDSDNSGTNSGTNSSTNSNSTSNTTSTTNTTGTSMQTTVQNRTASTVVSAAAGSRLVQAAVASQSDSIVIEPEVTSAVTKAEVSIPASTVGQISSQTDAALVVSASIAEVSIPNAALGTLSRAGGTVSVVTEQVEQSVVLTLTAGGETVESVPGGVTLTVPAEDAGPGTVAVLVHDDGMRETLRKVVVEDGKLSIPLDGSATVEVVDNSKDFTDVPDTDWAAEAVAFASAHELFNGTSETTFSPDEAMSRGMLATVLYNLEGGLEIDLTGEFSDVSGDAWYAEGIAWAAENGIVGGYGNGQFGPNDSITREQFVVMLWRYAGSPEASSQGLDFADADQASSYALEALCWAVENGILNGFGNGLIAPGGTATRAEAAQMLKNFMENT